MARLLGLASWTCRTDARVRLSSLTRGSSGRFAKVRLESLTYGYRRARAHLAPVKNAVGESTGRNRSDARRMEDGRLFAGAGRGRLVQCADWRGEVGEGDKSVQRAPLVGP